MKIKSGDTIGKYKIGEVLGQGGMATVYKAVQEPLGRNVALKVLHQHLTIEKTVRERFLLEAQAIASMKHPNIVQVYDFEASDEVSFISMEYIDGGALDQQLKAREISKDKFKPIPVKQALEIARDISEALDYAHKFGIIHRDVKPGNILIGTDGRYVLTDFGIATLLHQNRMTADGATSGTPTYIPPEMITGDRGDKRSDIYSLGIVLYQLLTGELPFNSENLYGILMKHINEPLPSMSEINPEVDEAVSYIVNRAAQKNGDDRYQSGQELADEIQNLLNSPKYAQLNDAEADNSLVVSPIHGASENNWVEITKVRLTGWFRWIYQFSQIDWRMKAGAAGLVLLLVFGSIFLNRRAGRSPEVEAGTGGEVVGGLVELTDSFDNNDLVWPTGGAPRWIQLVDGVYEMRIEKADSVVSAVPVESPEYEQYTFSANIIHKDGPLETGYGLVFNYKSPRDYHVFGVNGLGQWSVWNLTDGVWVALKEQSGSPWIPSSTIEPYSNWNNLRVEVRADEMDLFINNQFVERIPVNSEMDHKGQIGFYLATPLNEDAKTSVVQFDDVSVMLPVIE